MKSHRRILLLAILVLIPLALPAPGHAARKMDVTVQDDGVFLYNQGYYSRDQAYLQLREMGASTLRMNVLWQQTMPSSQALSRTKPATINYDFRMWDEAVAAAKSYGIKVVFDLAGDPPRWACGNKKPPGTKAGFCRGNRPNAKAYGQFAEVVARHFRGRVKTFSIWNEPNWMTWLSPLKEGPRLYRKLYQRGYAGVKRGNRRAKVLMGELAPFSVKRYSTAPLKFLREMVCVNRRFQRISGAKRKCPGKALKLDGFAMHPYDFTNPPTKRRRNRDEVTMASLDRLTETLDRLQRKRLIDPSTRRTFLWLHEFGYFVKGPRRVSESKRKKWGVKGFDMAQRNPRVKAQLWYVFVSPPANHPSAFFDLGLIATNGFERGAFGALKTWANNAARSGRVSKPGRCSVPC